MKQIHKLISLLMTVGMVPVIPLAVTAENEEAPYKIGDFAYDPAWDCYEDWSKAIPNLRKYNVAAISDYVAACTDTGNRYIRLNWSTFGAMTFECGKRRYSCSGFSQLQNCQHDRPWNHVLC